MERGTMKPNARGLSSSSRRSARVGLACALLAIGCQGGGHDAGHASSEGASMNAVAEGALRAMIGPEGGELVGASGGKLAGVRLTIPKGALSDPTLIEISPSTPSVPLPKTAVQCGQLFKIQPSGLTLGMPATLTLPVDADAVNEQNRFADEVKVWVGDGKGWGQAQQIDSSDGSVSVQVAALQNFAPGVNPPPADDIIRFDFAPNPKFLPCLAQYPDDPSRAPSVEATIVRGDLNDGLFLRGKYIKPELAFDMFTVERSALDANGKPVAGFTNFGLAWYQSDLEANDKGVMRASIRTILLDQIFGFDPDVNLAPTGTFEVGFWFNDPNDAAACGFDVSKPTPFNGEHKAGPLAMISLPDAETGLGPLCTHADTSVTPARCDP